MAMCKGVVENIIGYIEAELDYKTLEELEKHLYECPECQAFVRTYRKMLELIGKLRLLHWLSREVINNEKGEHKARDQSPGV